MTAYTKARDTLEEHFNTAKAISRRAEDDGNRDFTPAEVAEIEGHIDAAKLLSPRVRMLKADQAMTDKLRALGPDVGGDLSSYPGGSVRGGGYKATGSAWSEQVAGRLTKSAASHGSKDLSAGSLDVPNPVELAVQIPARPTRLLDLIPRKSLPGNAYAYAKQVLRTNNATAVADGALKPTSHYTFVEVLDRARVFAHISEPLALRMFDDFNDLMTIIEVQMYEGILQELEDNCATGDGSGEFFTGILHTSGTYATPYTTSVPATLRAARTQLEVANETPTSWVVNPADAGMLDLLADNEGRFYGAEIAKIMNLPVVSSTSIPAGHAILGDWSQSRLYVREDANLLIDRSGPLFTHNQLMFRYEGRYGYAVLRPSAFSIVDLTP